MIVRAGSVLGGYEITELIGQGGMGAVYRARDSRLGRDVAIKIIHPQLTADPDRLSRFEREARLLASLTHPHIATVYGFEQAGSTPLLVLELVEGETLAERLAAGALPVKEALQIAREIAAAVEAAHDRGIIHRDLKPANIKLTPTVGVKVLDFGLAKALDPAGSSSPIERSPTLTSGGTGEGVILGTAAFMSPEQARGKPVDRRSDIWAFGCVLFDMLTGRLAFAGDTLSDTIANILTREPDWSALPRETPRSIRRLLRRSLEKDLTRRLRDIGDARLEIEDALEMRAEEPGETAAAAPESPIRWLAAPLAGVLAGALAASVALWLIWPESARTRPATVSFAVSLPESDRLTSDFPVVAFAPDEAHIAYIAGRGGRAQIHLRALAGAEAVPLAGTDGAFAPFFSSDSQWIGFFADGKLKKVAVQGGPVRTIADAPIGFGGSWVGDTIVFAPANGSSLLRVSADGGTPVGVTELDAARGEFSHRWPELLPDGSAVVFTAGAEGSWDDAEIVMQPLGSGRRQVLANGTSPRVVQGQLAYMRGGSLFVVPLHRESGRALDARQVLAGVAQSLDGAGQFSLSRSGGLVYVPGTASPGAQTLAWVDRRGDPQPLPAPARAFATARLSPDGRLLALAIGDDRGEEIWIYDIARNSLSQLTYEGGSAPVWSPDGVKIIFSTRQGVGSDLFWKSIDNSEPPERLTRGPGLKTAHSVSPDGRTLAFVQGSGTSGRDIMLLTFDDRRLEPFLQSPADETAASFSPDGRSVAFVSDATGRSEVFVTARGDPGRAVQVSTGGGTEPVWGRNGRELFFRAGDRMMVASVRTELAFDTPRELFRGDYQPGLDGLAAYDVSRDGARLLMIRSVEANRPDQQLRVILGWSTALESAGK